MKGWCREIFGDHREKNKKNGGGDNLLRHKLTIIKQWAVAAYFAASRMV
jgi:hypothetical protein